MTGRIAFVGLGSMGMAMASNLIAAGFAVAGYDVRASAGAALAEKGGIAAASAAEAADGADALILMVVNAAQARTVLFEQGALDALPSGAPVCLMSTCPPDEVVILADRVRAAGRVLVDCPVSGGVTGAKAGTLSIMAAAPAEDFERVRSLLAAMGSKLFHVGETAGQGAAVKAINQLLCGVHIVAAAEALALGERSGVDTSVLLEIVSGSAAASWMLSDRGPRMLQSDPEVTSAVDIFVKDLGIAIDAGKAARMGLPLAAVAHQMFTAESGAGGGADDDSQVIRAYRRLNGF